MSDFKIGIITDCLKNHTLEESLADAKSLGVSGVQIYATTGVFSPEVLTQQKKSYYKDLLKSSGLVVSALCADTGGFGFELEKDNPARIEITKKIIDLAVEFDSNVVTSHIGVIPKNSAHPIYSVMLKALTECGEYAKQRGVVLAIETDPEKVDVLKNFIDSTKGGVGVNLDPANFVMVTGQDPIEAVYILKDSIVHTHVKDGVMLDENQDPGKIYHAFALGGIEALNAMSGFKELPIGQGKVDWDNYLTALKEIGYNDFLTIEREAGENVIEDMRNSVCFIKTKIDSLMRK